MENQKIGFLCIPCELGEELFEIIDSPWVECAKQIVVHEVTGFHIYKEESLSGKYEIKSKLLFQKGYDDGFAYFSEIGNTLFYDEEETINKLNDMGFCIKDKCGQILVYKRQE